MPRPKVAPQNRQRASRACMKCRSSKKRCNGQQPCLNCIRKGRAGSCVFTDSVASPNDLGDARAAPTMPASSRDGADSGLEPHTTLTPSLSGSIQHVSPEASHRTHPRLLNSLQGDKGKMACSRQSDEADKRISSLHWTVSLTSVPATDSGCGFTEFGQF